MLSFLLLIVFPLLIIILPYNVISQELYIPNSKYTLKRNHMNNTAIMKLSEIVNKKNGYWCTIECNLPLLQVEVVHKDKTTTTATNNSKYNLHKFSSKYFLETLRNQRLAVVGDSLGLQLYSAIDARLDPYQLQPNDIKNYKYKDTVLQYPEHFRNHPDASARFYPYYNVTILWCKDPSVTDFFDINSILYQQCGKEVIKSDYIVFGFGAWYKPLYRDDTTDFLDSMLESEVSFHQQMRLIKQHMTVLNPSTKLLWRLNPHAGNVDEHTHQAYGFNTTDEDHAKGEVWSHTNRDSVWVRRLNDIIRYNVFKFHDVWIDWFELSYLYMDYFDRMNMTVHVHIDSLHYCAAGVPRGSMLLLQDAIMSINSNNHHKISSSSSS